MRACPFGCRCFVIAALMAPSLGCELVAGIHDIAATGASAGGAGGATTSASTSTSMAMSASSSASSGGGGKPTCFDGKKNGDETDIDCGGGCDPCALGKLCVALDDCIAQASACADGRCQPPLVAEWQSKNPGGTPPPGPRFGATMVFPASATDPSVLMLGQISGNSSDLVWSYNLVTNVWTKLPLGAGPVPQGEVELAAVALPNQGVLVMGGEQTALIYSNRAWFWTGTVFAAATPAALLTARAWGGAAVVPNSSPIQVLLFGGTTATPVGLGTDIWTDDATPHWSSVDTTLLRVGAGLAPDAQNVICFGGAPTSNAPPVDETYRWTGSAWQPATVTVTPPSRAFPAMAYDSRRRRIVMFGGSYLNVNTLDDTFEWDGSDWSLMSPATSPSARTQAAMAFDETHGAMVLYGGAPVFGTLTNLPTDTWTYQVRANVCETGADCDTALCVDHLCCAAASCGVCEACNVPSNPGVCTAVPGCTP